ncbi:MAG: uroporphyrinogen-III synthase [Lentimicrobium sp.]|nr:uroporphyrinogen-III synthase [Lentimicrobium sp.]MDD2526989.1 uroporphyrinogen-III synthase [Lentimicrobiaceae bacterium]MDD4597815.1 uroporphyrinogen-III synthase [Lentimicrobiaceae bacterium]MDY0025003.1 uroporphyrinogen-III synthase [Lentimicrobium sp.]HAH57709.1 uroporphyrinogen-III synthase [Bacteroidales bacterium]
MKVKNILISQPRPAEIEKSPYADIVKKYGINIDFHKFFRIEGLSSIDFRKENKVRLSEHSAVIFTSKHGVDNFFRLAGELRFEVPESMKYFCSAEAIALYLQKYIQYRKRKIFFSNQELSDLVDSIRKHKNERYLLPCNEDHNPELSDLLDLQKIDYDKVIMYRTVSEDMSFLEPEKYDLMVFFSPAGIKSLLKNFKNYKQKDQLIGVFGPITAQAAREFGLKVAIEAPNEKAPSMARAIDQFLANNHKGK